MSGGNFDSTSFDGSVGGFDVDASTTPTIDTHDGFDEDSHKHATEDAKREAREFRGARERLRDVIEQAWDGDPGPVAAEVKAAAAPYVERLESGAVRIDYKAIERRKAVMAEVLALQDSLRAEFDARMALHRDDEDVILLTASLWN